MKPFQKQQILSPEEVTLGGWYTFNLNPEKQYEFEATPVARWNKTYQDIQATISRFIPFATIEGFLEISRTGRIHMHGYIEFKDIAGFYLMLPAIMKHNHLEIDTITDPEHWYDYCTKSRKLLKSYQTDIKQDRLSITKNQFLDFI